MKCRSTSGCKNNAYKELDYCALHCSEKNIDENESHEYLMSFYRLFRDYLYDKVEVEIYRLPCANRQELDEQDNDLEEYHLFVNGAKPEGISASLIEMLEKIEIEFKKFKFPNDDDFGYLDSESRELLRWLGKVVFTECSFSLGSLNLNSNFYYRGCIFHNKFFIKPFPQVESKDYRYINCRFENDVSVGPSRQSNQFICKIFEDCNFEEDVILKNIDFKETVFQLSDPLEKVNIEHVKEHFSEVKANFKFKKIYIEKCNFESSFMLNGFDKKYLGRLELCRCEFDEDWLNISSLEVIDTEFSAKFELKNRVVENLKFKNSNVLKIFDINGSTIKKTHFEKNIFYDFAGFENVVFGAKNTIGKPYIAKFEYTTFESFSNFRSAKFYSGLDFKNTNRDKEPNFLNAYINNKYTDRETFRIIKHSFDSVGNKIEAGRYHAYEMNAYIKELSLRKIFWKLMVLYANRYISKFGQSYILPLMWLLFSVLLYTYLLWRYQNTLQNGTLVLKYSWMNWVTEWMNTASRNFLPFAKFVGNNRGFECVSLIFYIIFGIFIWQTIVAVKKQTQN